VGSNGFDGSERPSTTGPKLSPPPPGPAPRRPEGRIAAISSCIGTAWSLSSSLEEIFSRCSTCSVVRTACAFCVDVTAAPLCAMARWKSPLADGIAISVLTFPAPPDWPKMVTLFGSPPNGRDVVAHPFERGHHVEHAALLASAHLPPNSAR
jgi:hypothetical protein